MDYYLISKPIEQFSYIFFVSYFFLTWTLIFFTIYPSFSFMNTHAMVGGNQPLADRSQPGLAARAWPVVA